MGTFQPGTLGLLSALTLALATGLAGIEASGSSAPPPGQSPPPAEELAQRIQARQQTIRDFPANFTETMSSPLLPRPSEERGEIKVKKPGRLRMTYRSGDRNEFVADGTTLYAHFAKDKYVTRSALPDHDDAPTWISFLAGRGDLARDFTARLAETQPPGEWQLVLTPRQPQADFRSLTLHVDRASMQLRGLVVVDAQGTTSLYRFSNLRENIGLPDREFQFQVPKGVAVRVM